jgi:tRNA-2-methylthio-N6-dimethylallyladenosine synthase
MKKVYIETHGCQMNVSDSERVATLLDSEGYVITSTESEADIVLLNTCSVREKAEHKLYSRVGAIRDLDDRRPMLGVMGCVAQLEGDKLITDRRGIDFVVGTKAVGRVAEIIKRVTEGEDVVDLGDREAEYDWSVSDRQRNSPYVSFVPIIEGCNKFCTYCIVPFSRGREKSLPASLIIDQVRHLNDQGVREIHLIGQNVNSYRPTSADGLEGIPGATPFAKLLRAVAQTGIERIKFATSFPRDFHPDIVDAIDEYENLCNWVHLPVQSGSDSILKAMRRGHSIESYKKRIDRIRDSNRDISLTTDIIVGFPGETEKDFQQTLDLAEYCRFDSGYIFKYSPRPGTPAFELEDDVTPEEKSIRFQELQRMMRKTQREAFDRQVGKTLKVLAERTSAKSADVLTGHSTCHRLVNFPCDSALLGRVLEVEVTETKVNSLFGRVKGI